MQIIASDVQSKCLSLLQYNNSILISYITEGNIID